MNKKVVSLLAVVVLLVTAFAFTTSASATFWVFSHCSNGKPLNVRDGAGKDYPIIDRIPYGEPIYIEGEPIPGWYELADGKGYVMKSLTCANDPGPYKPSPAPAPSPTTSPSGTEAVFATARTVTPYLITLKATPRSNGVANIRWAPSKTSKLQASYPPGTEMRVLAEMKNWYQVENPITGAVGFVNVAYVQK